MQITEIRIEARLVVILGNLYFNRLLFSPPLFFLFLCFIMYGMVHK